MLAIGRLKLRSLLPVIQKRSQSCTAASHLRYHGFAIAIAGFIRLTATLIGQKADQAFHPVKSCAVKQKPSFASHGDEPGVLQLLYVERQRGSRYAELVRDHTCAALTFSASGGSSLIARAEKLTHNSGYRTAVRHSAGGSYSNAIH
jgi:hypothetical protein